MLWLQILVWVVTIVLLVVGFLGTFLPALPGAPLIFIGALVYAIFDHFTHISVGTLLILGFLTVFVVAMDYASHAISTKVAGASKLATTLAIVGAIVGVFTGLWGVIVFPFIGAVAGELIIGKNIKQSLKAGTAAFLGFLGGTLLKVIVAAIMIGIFLVAAI